MRVHVLNDLHLEATPWGTFPNEGAPPAADLVILAGDIHTQERGVIWAAERWPTTPVIYVPGNHEYEHRSWGRAVHRMQDIAPGHVHVLEMGRLDIAGMRVLGTTLWTDFALAGHQHRRDAIHAAAAHMPEYRLTVGEHDQPLAPAQTLARHKESVAWLRREAQLARTEGIRLIVATHHPPLRQARRPTPGRGIEALDAAYASHRPDLVRQIGAALWVFGHTHVVRDQVLYGTRFISNTRGLTSIGGDHPIGFAPDHILTLTP
jgi:predicted phosphodiesterase